jgi:mRNA-degrading endonuclease RelE of RelBE toxin-antitoxin system
LADIVPVEGSEIAYRLRSGRLRVEYEVYKNDKTIKLLRYSRRKENPITDKSIY